jgi:hypothetical protein
MSVAQTTVDRRRARWPVSGRSRRFRLPARAALAAGAATITAAMLMMPAASAAGTHDAAASFYAPDAVSGNTAVITGPDFGLDVSVYVHSGRGWHLQATLTNPPGDDGVFGSTAAIAGSTLVVGCGQESDSPPDGMAYIYQRSGSHWVLQAAISPPEGRFSAQNFGRTVAISASTVIIAANNGAYIYARTGSTWHLQQTILTPFPPPVALAGNTAVIGNAVYLRSGSRWQRHQVLSRPVFMTAALSDRELARGNWQGDDYVGNAYVYQLSGTRWRLQASIPSTHPREEGTFGEAVAIAGTTLFVGSDAGARGWKQGGVYVYHRSGSRWIHTSSLYEPGSPRAPFFGSTISLSGNTLLIGGGAGAYFYQRAGNSWRLQLELS